MHVCNTWRVRSQACAVPARDRSRSKGQKSLAAASRLVLRRAPSFGPSLKLRGNWNAAIAPIPAAAADADADASPAFLLLCPYARALEHAASPRSVPRRLPLRDRPFSLQLIIPSLYNALPPFLSRPFRAPFQCILQTAEPLSQIFLHRSGYNEGSKRWIIHLQGAAWWVTCDM